MRIPSWGEGPSDLAVSLNVQQCARFAKVAQASGLVPLVEPGLTLTLTLTRTLTRTLTLTLTLTRTLTLTLEVLMDGCHSIETTFVTQKRLFIRLFAAMAEHGVHLDSLCLKPSFVLPGIDWGSEDQGESIGLAALKAASYTLELLEQTVPCSVRGLFFLSGGLSDEYASSGVSSP